MIATQCGPTYRDTLSLTLWLHTATGGSAAYMTVNGVKKYFRKKSAERTHVECLFSTHHCFSVTSFSLGLSPFFYSAANKHT
jgi:hypothetical protein